MMSYFALMAQKYLNIGDAQFPLLRSELRFATVCYGSSAT